MFVLALSASFHPTPTLLGLQEAAIGSAITHPNIVSVYSISLRPAGMHTPLTTPGGSGRRGSGGSDNGDAGNVLLLRQEGTAVLDASGGAASWDLVPWTMQLVLEYCDQVSQCSGDVVLILNRGEGSIVALGLNALGMWCHRAVCGISLLPDKLFWPHLPCALCM